MENMVLQNGIKEMIRNHTRILVEFKDGIPYLKFYDSWSEEFIITQLDINELEDLEEYLYYIQIEAFSFDTMCLQCFTRYHKTESDALDDMNKFKVGDEYFDDVVIKKVRGPYRT